MKTITTPFLPLLAGAFVLEASPPSRPGPAASGPANVLMIIVDDLNDWITPLAGHPQARTPNFERLAARGMVFSNAHVQAPLCGPSRASVFTGLHPSTSGIYLHVGDEDIKESNEATRESVFLTHYLRDHGYRTMGIGKILHRGAGADLLEEYGGHFNFGPFPERRLRYDRPRTSTDWGAYPERDEEMPDHQVASYAMEKLMESHDGPFFLIAGFYRPHVPWHVPQKWFDLFPLDSIVTPPYNPNDRDDLPEISRIIHDMPPTPETNWLIEQNLWKEVVQAYLACVAFVDAQLGRILDALEAGPHDDNTIVVLWSDHGYHLGEKNVVAKMTLWEESSKVPFMISAPGFSGGRVCSRPVEMTSIYPTLLDLLGLPPNPQNDGVSLVPLLRDPEAAWDRPALVFWGPGNTAVRSERHRYILYEDGSEELYDHAFDPQEWSNLAGRGIFREIKADLSGHIPSPQAPMSAVNYFNWNDYWREKTGP